MVAKTKLFGEIDINDEKVILFEQGLIGFENLKKFAILFDTDHADRRNISWLQSLEEPTLAFPIIDPFLIREDYNPEIEDSGLATLGDLKEEDLNVLVTLSVPKDIKQMSCNLKAPIIINVETRKGAQLIAENNDYPIKYYIYDILDAKRQKKEGR